MRRRWTLNSNGSVVALQLQARICISPSALLLLLLLSTAPVHDHCYGSFRIGQANGLQFTMPNFLNESNITLVTEGGWYTDQGFNGAYVNGSGVAVLNTLNSTSQMGRMVYDEPVNLLNPRSNTTISFNTSFTFQIITSNLSQCGSGLVFAVTDFLESPAYSYGDSLGLVNATTYDTTQHFFAIEFDTYLNSDNYTADPSDSHLGVDVGNLFSAMIYDTSYIPSLYLYNNYTFTCWVDYNSSTHFIRVWMTNSTTTTRPSSPLIEFQYDLSLVTTNSMYVGFTGTNYGCANGDQSSAIFSWYFNSDLDGDLLPLEASAAAPAQEEKLDAEHNGNGLRTREIWFVVLIAILCLVIIAGTGVLVVVVFKRKGRKKRGIQPTSVADAEEANLTVVGDSSTSGARSLPADGASVARPQMFNYSDVLRAAKGFSEENKIGEGMSSNVYKGVMPGGAVMAVKRLKEGLRKQADFFMEMALISNITHPNLLELKGWCYHESGEAMLIYDYMSNGSLDAYLFGNRDLENHNRRVKEDEGRVRMKVLVGVAAALDHLHWGTDPERCVLHRDVKAANVLLTEDMEAKLGDFGLARLVDHNHSMVMTTAMGTVGYVAPEVLSMAKITDKADVYSFGVLMLEVACGKRAFTPGHGADGAASGVHIVTWIDKTCYKGMGMQNCIDRWLPVAETEAWERVVNLGRACCSQTPTDRPNMREVYHILLHIEDWLRT